MKLLVSALVLGFALTALTSVAEARVCANGAHRTHCISHKRYAHMRHYRYPRHYEERGVIVAAPTPYVYVYPPFSAPIVDNPSAPYRNPLQWLMDQEGDVPFTSYPVYPWRW
jgi:hypothetical protein